MPLPRLVREIPQELVRPTVLNEELGFWSAIRPEATTNLVVNPTFEVDTTGWTNIPVSGTVLSRDGLRATRGVYSLKIHPVAPGGYDGARTALMTVTQGAVYTLSADVWGAPGVPYQLTFYQAGQGIVANFVGNGAWQHVVATGTATFTGGYVQVWKQSLSDTSDFWVDGVQFEQKGYETSFCVGSKEGCSWAGQAHNSTSSRDASHRLGGRAIPFDWYNFTLLSILGAGAGTFTNVAVPNGLQGGATFQRAIPQPRDFHIAGRFECQSLIDLQRCQQGLLDLVKPNNAAGALVRLIYQPAQGAFPVGDPMQIDAVYTGGLEGALATGIYENVTLSFKTYLPNILGTTIRHTGSALAYSQAITVNGIAQRDASGNWASIGSGVLNPHEQVLALALGPGGAPLYAGGTFLGMGGVANTAYVAEWINGAWQALGTGAADTGVYCLAVGPGGTLYAGGGFSQMGGMANTPGIAYWDGASWRAMGTGAAGGSVYALAVLPDGSVIAGGNFTGMGGVANTSCIAKWNGSAWVSLIAGITSNTIYALAVDARGGLYIGAANGLLGSNDRVAYFYNGVLSQMGAGVNGTVRAICVRANGTVFVGGDFTVAYNGASPGVALTVNYIARWNGSLWVQAGGGMDGSVKAIASLPDRLYAGGSFTHANGLALTAGLAVWTNPAWAPTDLTFPAGASVAAVVASTLNAPNNTASIALGFTDTGAASAAGVTSVTNSGTVDAYPVFTLTGPMTLWRLTNFTTGDQMGFNLTLSAGETVTLTTGPNWSIVSSFRGAIPSTVLAGSAPATWRLAPGANSISLFATATSGATASAMYFNAAFDGIAGAVKNP